MRCVNNEHLFSFSRTFKNILTDKKNQSDKVADQKLEHKIKNYHKRYFYFVVYVLAVCSSNFIQNLVI